MPIISIRYVQFRDGTGLLERCGGSMEENPPDQLGGMGEHCKLTIGVYGGMLCVYIEGRLIR